MAAYKQLLAEDGTDSNRLFISVNDAQVYLFFDSVHLIKNIRNNLLARRRFIFPPFRFVDFEDEINVPGGEVSWKLLHDVHKRDASLSANLKKAPQLNSKVSKVV